MAETASLAYKPPDDARGQNMIPKLQLDSGGQEASSKVLRLKYIVALNDPAFATARTHREQQRKKLRQTRRAIHGSSPQHHPVAGSPQHYPFAGSPVMYGMQANKCAESTRRSDVAATARPRDDGAKVAALQKMLGNTIGSTFGKEMPQTAPYLARGSRYEGEASAAPQKVF